MRSRQEWQRREGSSAKSAQARQGQGENRAIVIPAEVAVEGGRTAAGRLRLPLACFFVRWVSLAVMAAENWECSEVMEASAAACAQARE